MWTLYPSKNLLWLRTCLKFMIRFGICYSEKNINPRHDILSMFFQIFLNRILNRFLTLFALTLYFHLYSLAFICSFLAEFNFQTLPNISFEWFDPNFNVQTPEVADPGLRDCAHRIDVRKIPDTHRKGRNRTPLRTLLCNPPRTPTL